MTEDETIARLRAFGLNLYESRAYLALLNARQLTAKGVGQSSLIPQSRTYDILESLTRKGFAMATPASPPVYVAVPPERALTSYFDSKRKEIQGRAVKVHEEAQAKLEVIHDAYITLTKDFPATPGEDRFLRDRVWVLQTRENIESTLAGLIKDARSQVLRITAPPEPKSNEPLDPFYIVGLENQKFVYEALERGVEMKWLSLTREIPTYLGLTVNEPPERRYLEREEDITEKFLLVDNHSALLNLHDPMSPAYGYVAFAMQSRAVTSIFQDHFEKMWKKGRPLNEVLPRMKKLVEDVCSQLMESGIDRKEVTLYKTLARLGAVTQDTLVREMARKRIQQQDTLSLLERMNRQGLVHKDGAHRLMMVEHPSNVKALMSAGKLRLDSITRLTTHQSSSGKNL